MTPVSSPIVKGLLVLACAYGVSTPNPIESIWSILILGLILHWFWWQQQPGILLICLLIPFVEIHTTVAEANNYGLTLNELFETTGRKTFWLASIGFLSVLVGFKATLRRFPNLLPSHEDLKHAAETTSQTKLILAYIGLTLLATGLDRIIPWGSGLHQLETYFAATGQVILVAIGIQFWLTRQRPVLMALFFLGLVIVSFYSYFSEWRLPFTLLIITLLSSIKNFGVRQAAAVLPIAIPAFLLVFLWQSVKGEYRTFLSQGQRTQAVLVDRNTALTKFQELSSNALEQGILNEEVISSTYRRAGYLEYFSATLHKVPEAIPYEQGKLLGESLSFSLVPRILNPNKGYKNDREKVERYTDYYFGQNSFSSFSLGHYCEAYIDWGPNGMMFHLFLFGTLGAFILRWTAFRYQSINPLLFSGLLWVLLQPWGTFQQDMVTISGTIFWGFFCHLILFKPLYSLLDSFVDQNALQQP